MKDDKKLREVLQLKISQINNDLPKHGVKEIAQAMASKYNVEHGITYDIFNNLKPVESLSYDMLYKLMTCIREVSMDRWSGDDGRIKLNPDDLYESTYFNPEEIEVYNKKIKKADSNFDIVIKEWHLQKVGHYNIVTIFPTIDEVTRWNNANKFNYNPETQRDLVMIETDGLPIVKLDIKWKSIAEMMKLMELDIYFPVTGILNINPEENEELPRFRGNDFIIPQKCRIDLCEGFHNLIATTRYKNENKDWEFPCSYQVVMMNKEGINNVIRQMDKKNHFKEEQTARMDTSELAYLINALNTDSKFHLHGFYDKNIFLYLYKLIPNLFKIEDKRKQTIDLLNELRNKLNYVIEYTDHFDISFTKEEWFICLLLIKLCDESGLNFEKVIENIGINSLRSEITIKDKPLPKHYKLINAKVEEVKEYAI
jgi:hypothetical protein